MIVSAKILCSSHPTSFHSDFLTLFVTFSTNIILIPYDKKHTFILGLFLFVISG